MSITQFGFGDGDDKLGRKSKKLKMEKGQVVRVSFIWWPGIEQGTPKLDAASPAFVGGPRHYVAGVGYFLNKGPEYTKLAGSNPVHRAATLIVSWPVKGQGKLDLDAIQSAAKKAAGDPAFSDAKDIDVMGWVFDSDKYDQLKTIHAEWHFGGHDIMVTCTDATFQKLGFSPCKESVFKSLLDKQADSPLVKKICADATAAALNIRDDVGRDMSLDQIREKLQGGRSGGTPFQGGSPVAGNEQIDDALDSLLE